MTHNLSRLPFGCISVGLHLGYIVPTRTLNSLRIARYTQFSYFPAVKIFNTKYSLLPAIALSFSDFNAFWSVSNSMTYTIYT